MRPLLWLSALIVALLAALALDWASRHYTEAPAPPPVFDDPRIARHGAAHLARAAVRHYRALPPNERRTLAGDLAAALGDLPGWLDGVWRDASLLCLGERHRDEIRRFLGRVLLPATHFDSLMVEAAPPTLARILESRRQAHPATLLGAELDPVLDAVEAMSPPPALVGVDVSRAAPAARGAGGRGGPGGREDGIVANVRANWRPGARHVLLFGALHCRHLPGWLYHRLASSAPEVAAGGTSSAVLLARYQEPGAQMLFYLLEDAGLGRDVVVIPDLSRFPHEVLTWMLPAADALAGYDAAVLFDERALGLERLGNGAE